MSINALAWAFDQQGLTPSEKLVLIVLADSTGPGDDPSECWVSLLGVAKNCNLSEKAVNNIINRLIKKGSLARYDCEYPGGATNCRGELMCGFTLLFTGSKQVGKLK